MPDKMPDNATKPSSFKVAQPEIPGVPRAKTASDAKRQQFYIWLTGSAAVVILLVVVIWWARASTRASRSVQIVEAPRSAVPAQTPAPAPQLAIGPGPIATTKELSHPWATQKFLYRNPAGNLSPAMVVRLPGNAYWAFSLQAPYGTCELEIVTDTQQLLSDYKFSASYPLVADPCTHTLYDLTKYGNGPNGLVRGAVVAGTAIRPPLAIEVQVEGQQIIADRAERP